MASNFVTTVDIAMDASLSNVVTFLINIESNPHIFGLISSFRSLLQQLQGIHRLHVPREREQQMRKSSCQGRQLAHSQLLSLSVYSYLCQVSNIKGQKRCYLSQYFVLVIYFNFLFHPPKKESQELSFFRKMCILILIPMTKPKTQGPNRT